MDASVLVSYLHPICDFAILGVTRCSFVDKALTLFKSVPIRDVLENWRLLVGDEKKTFNTKCEEILCILRYLQKEPSLLQGHVIAKVSEAATKSPLFPSQVEEQFCFASQLCLNQNQPVFEDTFCRLNSYLCKNDEISYFLERLGIVKNFEPIDFKIFLENCKLIKNEIQAIQVRDILEFLRSRREQVRRLPDDNGLFRDVDELCLNDFKLSESLTEMSPLHCHRFIPHDLARFFGVKTKRSMLESMSSDPSFETFSQKEDLCNRLYRITTNYSNPMDIFKELIQNADDARASEIQFILDQRNLPKQRVINDNWEKLLEPALLVFNDAFFTSEDIKGIKDLGKGSKGDDVDKIGQFGVGFNCVFSITDHPCFLTQVDGVGPGNMCLLDPSCQITPDQGKKININEDLFTNFPDSFGCFFAENWKLDGRKGKTMFRLPLRRKESSLGKTASNFSEMSEKLEQLAEKLPEYLLFLPNIKTIRILRTNTCGDLTEIAAFSKKTEKRTAEISKVQINSISNQSQKVCEWLLSERKDSSQQIPDLIRRLFSRGLQLKEHGSVAFPLYLADSLKTTFPSVYCYLPIEAASALLRNESVRVPVVVNGQFFLDESRRMLSLQPREPKAAWNIHVLQHIVGPAYGTLIRYFISTLKTQIAPNDSIEYFLSMLPKLHSSYQLSSKSMESNLGYHISLGMMRYNADYAWIPRVSTEKKIVDLMNTSSILNLDIQKNKDLVLYKISSALDIPLTQIGPEYIKWWAHVGINVTPLSPSNVILKLADLNFDRIKIEATAFENSSNLVTFLKWGKKELNEHSNPNSLPIFLSANGILQRNTANKLFSSALSIAEIFPRLRDRILDDDVDRCLLSLKIACNLRVSEFFVFMKENFGQLCDDKAVYWSKIKGEISIFWVRLVWDFLAHHQKEVLEKFRVPLEKMSLLLCLDSRSVLVLLPVSISADYVFASFQTIIIGTVSINPKNYSSFYRISEELNQSGTQGEVFKSKFIMPSVLTVERHLHILNAINKENQFDKFSKTQRKQLYSYFRDSFCNKPSIFSANELEKLRNLPIFSFVNSTAGCLPLSAFSSVVSMSPNIPLDGLTLTDNETNRMFVFREDQEAIPRGAQFQQKLGIESKSDAELYSIFIPKFFPRMNKSEMKTHFQYLESKLFNMKEADRNSLKDLLQKTEFVTDEYGNKLALANVFQIELRSIIGYSIPISDFAAVGIVQNGYVDKLVGAYKFPPVSKIVSNWKLLTEDSSKNFDLKCFEICEIVNYLVARNLDKGANEEVADALKQQNLLPANDVNQFCKSSSICLNENAPVYNGHLYRVNSLVTKGVQNLEKKQFLRKCEVVDSFAPSKYSEIINSIQTVERPEQVKQMVSILWFICKDHVDVRQLPDSCSVMRPIDELCLNDFELSSNALEDSLNFCHEQLPHKLCKMLGVKTKRSKLKEMNSEVSFEPFVQREDINKRLARIAESYSNPMDIFKELIQNADDAQATQVHFILDQRILPTKHVIDRGFEKLLEPALLVFNNAPFKSSDIEGIQRVGCGSKGDDIEKIGQFGVGFNCVYSLTDSPCFLTQVDGKGTGSLLLLDPLCIVNKTGGCKIHMRESFVKTFKDSFNCFLRDKEGLDATKEGSMFRFPLRIKKSNLGKAAPKMVDMETKLIEFSSKISEYLLFLNYITSIEVSILAEKGIMKCIGNFSKKIARDNKTTLEEFRSHMKQFLSVNSHTEKAKLNIMYNIDIMNDTRSKLVSRWIVSEQLGSERAVPDIIRKNTAGKYKVKEHASVAFPVYLDDSLKGTVPSVYCYLPIEAASALLRNESVRVPVVVNGQFFLDESRRMLSLEPRDPKSAWNIHVLQHIVGPAYAKIVLHFVLTLTEDGSAFQLNEFLQKFPNCRDDTSTLSYTESMTSFVTTGFLDEMNKNTWVPCVNFDGKLQEFQSINYVKNFTNVAAEYQKCSLYQITKNLGLKLTQIPPSYTHAWSCYGTSILKLKPDDLIHLLRQIPNNCSKIEESVFESVNNLVIFLSWSSKTLRELESADDLPIFLTADKILRKNLDVQLYSSALSVAQIFPQLKERIVHHEIDGQLKNLKLTVEMSLNDFLTHLKSHYNEYCSGGVIEVNQADLFHTSRWIELVWKFLDTCVEPHEIQNDSTFSELSLLQCNDKHQTFFLRPISRGKIDTFVTFPSLHIGSVEVLAEKYSGIFELVSTSKQSYIQLIASAVLSKILTVKQQIMILHIIKDEFDFKDSESLQLYDHFRNSFENNTRCIDQESFIELRQLPIFALIFGEIDRLLGPQVYSIPREVPKNGLLLSRSVGYKYVHQENKPLHIEFQKKLGIVRLTTTQMYVEMLIPIMFEKFEFRDLEVHLEFLSSIHSNLPFEERRVLISSLQDCHFINHKDDIKQKPESFFDPHSDLFRDFKRSELLPIKFLRFRPLLLKCGVKKLTKNYFWQFVSLYSAQTDCENSFTVFCHFLEAFKALKLTSDDFDAIGRLAIFETEKHGYCTLSQVFIHCHKVLVEFIEPVLTSKTSDILLQNINFQWLWNSGCQKKPTADVVLKNLEKLIQAKAPQDQKILTCFGFIAKEASSGSQMDRNILERLSCIPCVRSANGRLLPPRQICKSFACILHKSVGNEVSTVQNHCELEAYVNEPSNEFLAIWDHLSILGASKFITLQQIVFAIDQFHGEIMTEIVWTGNPNSKQRFRRLNQHLKSFISTEVNELSSLSIECPIYLMTKDEKLVDIRGAIAIDDQKLYDELRRNSTSTGTVSGIDSDCSGYLLDAQTIHDDFCDFIYYLKFLPKALRPQFFSDICRVELDETTLSEANSAADEFKLERIMIKLRNDSFIEKLAHVLQHKDKMVDEDGFHRYPKRLRIEPFSKKCLEYLKQTKLYPVKKLFSRYTINKRGGKISDLFVRDFQCRENPNLEIFFQFWDNVNTDSYENEQKKNNLLQKITRTLFNCHKLNLSSNLDTSVINFLTEFLFFSQSEAEEDALMQKNRIPPLVQNSSDKQDAFIGNFIPIAYLALINYDIDSKIATGDFVAVKVSTNDDGEPIFKYGKLISEINSSENSSLSEPSEQLFKIQLGSCLFKDVERKELFSFHEKLVTESNQPENPSTEGCSLEEQLKRDVENIKQSVWTAVKSQKPGDHLESNMSELELRYVQTILNKYPNADQQQTLMRVLQDAIKTQTEVKRNEIMTGNVDTYRAIETESSEPASIVQNFVKRHYERMEQHIAAYKIQLEVRNVNEPREAPITRGRVQFCSESFQQPHPVLAKLWLQQARNHFKFLGENVEERNTSIRERNRNWIVDISLKVSYK